VALFAPDTSCIVATVVVTHEHHERAVTALDRHFDAGDSIVIVAHTLLEAYRTLTAMPRPHQMAPDAAWRAIDETFVARGSIVVLRPDDYQQMMSNLAAAGTIGGQVYDASIVACARLAGAEVIVTFNERHFRRFEGDGLTIEVP
jgi:predicted nucleic acid-binding protein